MNKTNKTFAEFAVKNGWKKTEVGKDETIVYYENMGFLITKEYQLKPVFIINDIYYELLSGKIFIYGKYAREIVEAVKKEIGV